MKTTGKRKRRIIIAAALILLALIIVDFAATELVFSTVFARYDEPAELTDEVRAEASGLEFEELSFVSTGNAVKARLYGAGGEALIVLIPGLHAGMDDHLPIIIELVKPGYAVLTFDPVGCRSSEGRDAGDFLQTVCDTEACLDFAKERGYFGCEHVFLIGHSRGGYAACRVLAERDDVEGAVVISAPDSAMDAVIGSTASTVGSFAANANYPMLWFVQALRYGSKDVTASAADFIDESGKPALIVQGEDDPYYTPERYSLCSKRDAIASDAVRYLLLPGGHTELMFDETGHASHELIAAIDGFFADCLRAGR